MNWHSLPRWEQQQLANRLTDKQFAVYALRLGVGGKQASLELIAESLNVSVWTVRTHLFRAGQVHDEIRKEAA